MFLIFDTETTGLPKIGKLQLLTLVIGQDVFKLHGNYMTNMEILKKIKVS